MKKSILITCLTILCSVSTLFADPVAQVERNEAGNKPFPYWRFSGFRFGSSETVPAYTPSRLGIENVLELEHAQIEQVASKNKEQYALIGHSQGGLRVLAYPQFLKNKFKDGEVYVVDSNGNQTKVTITETEKAKYKEEYDRIQAVITVSGIDKGLQLLDGGSFEMKRKINEDTLVLYRGVNGVLCLSQTLWPILQTIPVSFLLFDCQTQAAVSFVLVNTILPQDIRPYVNTAFDLRADINDTAEIRDMTPQSSFIKKYIGNTKQVDYRVQTGTSTTVHWGLLLFGIPFFWTTQEPVYATYTMHEDIDVMIPPEMPVGYIVGRNSNTLSMAGAKETEIRNWCTLSEVAFNLAAAEHGSRILQGYGVFQGSIGYLNDCLAAASWVHNIDGEMREIVGSPESDGLVAKECQFVQKKFVDPNTGEVRYPHDNVIGSDPRGYREFPQYNHANIFVATNKDVDDEYVIMLQQSVDKRKR